MSPRREAAAIFGLAVAGWAFPGVFVRMMPHLPAFPLVGLRLSVAWLTLSPFLLLQGSRRGLGVGFKNWRCWLLSMGMLVYYLVATPAFLYAPVGEVALVIASAPLFAVILRFIGKQPVSRLEILGAFLAIAGVLVMAAPSFGNAARAYPQEWLGVILAVTAAIAAAVYAIGNRHLLKMGQSPGPIVQVWLTFSLGLLLLPSNFWVAPEIFHRPTIWWLLPLGAISTALPTVAVAASSHRLSAVATTMINPLTSVCASIVAVIVIHEAPSIWMLLGGALVLAAVFTAASAAPAQLLKPEDLIGD